MNKDVMYWSLLLFFALLFVFVFDLYTNSIITFVLNSNPKNVEVIASDYKKEILPNPQISHIFAYISSSTMFTPEFVTISEISVINAQITTVGITDTGSMDVPSDPNIVGWYDKGPIVGSTGNIVLAGHYDWFNNVKGVFYNLNKLVVGDEIVISGNDQNMSYVVYEVKYVPNNDIDAVKEAFRNTTSSELTLITCGGVWDFITHSYDKRFLVKAILK